MQIEAFLNRDKFDLQGKLGNYAQIDSSQLNLKSKELLVKEQMDKTNNFDCIVKDDPL